MTVLDDTQWDVGARRARLSVAPMIEAPSTPTPASVPLRAVLTASDAFAVVVAWTIARIALGDTTFPAWAAGTGSTVAMTLSALAFAGLYRSRVSSVRALELARLPRVACVAAVVGALVFHRVEGTAVSWATLIVAAVALAGSLVLSRGMFDAYLRSRRARGQYCRSLLVVGGGHEAAEIRDLLSQHVELGYRLAGRVGEPSDGEVSGLPLLGDAVDAIDIAHDAGANGVLITSAAMSDADRGPLIAELLAAGLHVHVSAGLRGLDPRRLRVVPLAHEPMFYVEPSTLQPYQLRIKRAFDIVVGAGLLVIAVPVLLAAAVAIKLDGGGPVVYRQQRVGRYGRTFTCFKLRTMVVGADEQQDLLINARSGPLFKVIADPRVTRVGRFLRHSSIDELPQLLNVLRGEMSLVGPRPALPAEVARFDQQLLRRQEVPPGITGIWQVEARDIASFDAYRRLDLFYVENWRFSLDLVVLVLTVQVVLARLLRRTPGGEPPVGATGLEPAPIVLD